MAVVGGTECADLCRALPTMIRETFTDQEVSVVVSIDKTVLQVCYDLCKTELYMQTLLHVMHEVPGDVMHECSTPFFCSCTSLTFVVRNLLDVKSAVPSVFPHFSFTVYFQLYSVLLCSSTWLILLVLHHPVRTPLSYFCPLVSGGQSVVIDSLQTC